ncbi:hypothetical protein [Streptomyces palmae]|uniref:DUF1449 family protein n=1 Tax=Streptomyces palmae TaxID=1701085 RepID=A0A4Z0HDV2_9ACTN|nr:hypothetical protein [Streptomyces palmae]TGB19144.1 hypothetical protein E4099_00920 [Streptomyces palmae]
MGDFIRSALGFPAVLFSFALLIVAGFWLLVLLGGAGADAFDGGDGVDAGAAGVPVAVLVSIGVLIAWFVSLLGTSLTDRPWLRMAVLPAALGAAWLGMGIQRRLGRLLLPPERSPSREDFVGRTCVIRTRRVGPDFGQAEVTAEDGSSAIVQVRTDEPGLMAGSRALIFHYDADGEFFRVARFDSALDPYRPVG